MGTMKIELRASTLEIQGDILFQECIKGIDHNIDDAIENVKAGIELTKGVRHPTVVDARNLKSQSKEAREYYAGPENGKLVLSVALVIGNPFTRMFGNLFFKINKPPYPFQLFTSIDEAIKWSRKVNDA